MTDTQQQPLSKSQKKRMKQKAAKARKEAAEKPDDLDDSHEPAPIESGGSKSRPDQEIALNPHLKLRNDLAGVGFGSDEIEVALGEMWDLGMQYDEFDAALVYLEGKRVQSELEAVDGSVEEVADEIEELKMDGESDDAAASDSSYVSSKAEASTKEEEVEEPLPLIMDLASKLYVAANFENLPDALFALAEWANKAAKPHELIELCNIGKSSPSAALPTIIRRSILECQDDTEYATVLPSLQSLMRGILTSLPSGDKMTVVETLSNIIARSRSIVLQGENRSQRELAVVSVAEFVNNTISSTISGEDETLPEAEHLDLRELEEDIDAILAQQPATGNGVVELMTRRDCRKIAAEKSSVLAGALMDAAGVADVDPAKDSHLSANLRLSSDEAKSEFISSLFPDSGGGGVQERRRSYDSVQSRLESILSSNDMKHAGVKTELLALNASREIIDGRKDDLKREMEKLDRERETIMARELQLKETLQEASGEPNDEINSLYTQREELLKSVRFDDAVRVLVDHLGQFESSLMVLSMSASENKKGGMEFRSEEGLSAQVTLESKIGAFFLQMRNYFSSEADIVEFLIMRVSKLKIQVKELQREIAEWTALGLTTNVSQITRSMEEINQNIVDDEAVIGALRSEAQKMRDDLINRTAKYTGNADSLAPSQRTALGDVHGYLLRVGIESGFGAHVSESATSPVVADSMRANVPQHLNGGSKKEIITVASEGEPPVRCAPQPPVVMPKLSWAAPKASAAKAVKSFLDIQKEELSAKEEGGDAPLIQEEQ